MKYILFFLAILSASAQSVPPLPNASQVVINTNTVSINSTPVVTPVYVQTNVIFLSVISYPPNSNLPEPRSLMRSFDGKHWEFIYTFNGSVSNVYCDKLTTNAQCWYVDVVIKPDCILKAALTN